MIIFAALVGCFYMIKCCKKQPAEGAPVGGYGYAPQYAGAQNPFADNNGGAYQQAAPAYGGYNQYPQYGASPAYGQTKPANANPFLE